MNKKVKESPPFTLVEGFLKETGAFLILCGVIVPYLSIPYASREWFRFVFFGGFIFLSASGMGLFKLSYYLRARRTHQ